MHKQENRQRSEIRGFRLRSSIDDLRKGLCTKSFKLHTI
jgi:hypothetical protein